MNTNSDAQAAAREYQARQRERLGPPPTPDEMAAYVDGRLSEAAADRIRELLVCYPEYADILADDDDDDAAGALTDAELAQDWAAIRMRMAPQQPAANVVPMPSRWSSPKLLALAASVAIALAAGVFMQSRVQMQRGQPIVFGERHVLMTTRTRGAAERPYELPAGDRGYLLALSVVNPPPHQEYQVEIVDDESGQVLWKGAVRRQADDTFALAVPAPFLGSRTRRLQLYGVTNGERELLETYSVHIGAAR